MENNIYNEFLEIVRNNKIKFVFYKPDLYIEAEINMINVCANYVELFFSCGKITIWKDSRIVRCKRPSNIIVECKHCFRLYSQYNESIGHIYC